MYNVYANEFTPSRGRTKAGRPARTYIRQLCTDTGSSFEDLPEVMNDRDGWRERVKDIRAAAAAAADDIPMI